jgi:hypothetical protein
VDVAGTADIVFQRDNAVSGKLELDFASALANFNSVNDGLTFSQNAVKALQIRGGDISFYEDTGTTPKFFWDASAERLNLTGDDDFQFSIKQGANEAWFLRAVSDGRFSLHLNGTGDIVTATSTGLGIGAILPAQKLHVSTAGNNYIVSHNTAGSTSALLLGAESGSTSIYSWTTPTGSTGVPLKFFTGASQAMTLDASGNLLVGTTFTTNARTTIESAVNQNTIWATCPSFNWYPIVSHNTATSGDNVFAAFGTEASFTQRGSISYNRAGGLTAYNTTSDYRAKDIAGPISDASGAVLNLKPYMGTMKGATVERPMFVAHETQEIAPYAVTGEKDAVDGDGNPKYQQMDHSALVPLLTAALQEALTKIEALEARITALESA